MSEVLLATGMAGAALLAFVLLPPCHPAQLWLVPWAAVLVLFALQLLPYRDLSLASVVLIAAGTATFVGGTVAGERMARRHFGKPTNPSPAVIRRAATMAAVAALVLLVAFLVEVARSFGLRSALVADAEVRLAIGGGASVITIKYIYFAFAAAILGAMAAARSSGRQRAIGLSVAVAAVVSQYFSTGRSNVLLAAVMALVAFALASSASPRRSQMLLISILTIACSIPLFLVVGALLGKSYTQSDLATFDNTFTRQKWAQPLALPYQYATAPVAALNEVVAVTEPLGRADGCATLRVVCAALARASLPVEPEPELSGFTAAPSSWNTFTALYAPLVDVGPYAAVLILLIEGLALGILWRWAAGGSVVGIGAYAGMAAAVVYSTVENNLLAPHLIGAGLVSMLLVAVARTLEPNG